jgi:hypothetical protein
VAADVHFEGSSPFVRTSEPFAASDTWIPDWPAILLHMQAGLSAPLPNEVATFGDASARSIRSSAVSAAHRPTDDETSRRPLIVRGAITVTFDPVEITWNSIRVALSPLEAHVFALVARRGRVPWGDVNRALVACGGCIRSRNVLLCRLRHKFIDIGAADPLQTIRGWGLKFRVEPSVTGSRTVWIGRSEPVERSDLPRR